MLCYALRAMLHIGNPPLLSSELDPEPGPKVLADRVIQETECRSRKMGDVVEYPGRKRMEGRALCQLTVLLLRLKDTILTSNL